jgi:hypothetical protein
MFFLTVISVLQPESIQVLRQRDVHSWVPLQPGRGLLRAVFFLDEMMERIWSILNLLLN